MPKTPYEPTPVDAATGANLRALRQRRGETLKQTVEASGFGKDASTLAATERGERLLTDLEATKLAAHFNTTADQIRAYPMPTRPAPALTEQAWLGNDKPAAPALFAVPEPADLSPGWQKLADEVFGTPAAKKPRTITIDLDNPPTPECYRADVWIPYLEARYTQDTA